MRGVLILTFVLALSVPNLALVKPVKDGFYRISNAKDSGFLTATKFNGENQELLLEKCSHPSEPTEEIDASLRLPRKVIVSKWKSLPTQEWKVKTQMHGGTPLQIIRNERIRDNEVSKRYNTEKEDPSELDFVPTDFNLENQNEEGYFEITDGFGCLESRGLEKGIILECECDQSLEEQQWKFEFLYDIPKVKGTAD